MPVVCGVKVVGHVQGAGQLGGAADVVGVDVGVGDADHLGAEVCGSVHIRPPIPGRIDDEGLAIANEQIGQRAFADSIVLH